MSAWVGAARGAGRAGLGPSPAARALVRARPRKVSQPVREGLLSVQQSLQNSVGAAKKAVTQPGDVPPAAPRPHAAIIVGFRQSGLRDDTRAAVLIFGGRHDSGGFVLGNVAMALSRNVRYFSGPSGSGEQGGIDAVGKVDKGKAGAGESACLEFVWDGCGVGRVGGLCAMHDVVECGSSGTGG